MAPGEPDTEQLLAAARDGDESARGRLLDRHRQRLRGMVAVRMDPRLAARVDPSDLVQETLAVAHCRLDDYLKRKPLPFYPWLRQIAVDRLVDLHRRHVRAGKRAVGREGRGGLFLSDESMLELGRRVAGSRSTPSSRLRRDDRRLRLKTAMDQLSDRDREVLVLRYLEQMPPHEIAAVLDVSEAAVYTRHVRALERLRRLLDPSEEGEQ